MMGELVQWPRPHFTGNPIPKSDQLKKAERSPSANCHPQYEEDILNRIRSLNSYYVTGEQYGALISFLSRLQHEVSVGHEAIDVAKAGRE